MATVEGWNEPLVYCDAGISGTRDATRRPELQRLLSDVRSGTVAAVIILSLDRLGRETRLVLDLVEEFSRHGVALVSCKESLDTTSPQGQFVLTMFAALAQLERDLISERTKAALSVQLSDDQGSASATRR
jgi:DNA invertase Pin-like site-specific DNA recombinase